jgi:hypothetical protein
MSEYNNASVSGPSCSYARLSRYNNSTQGMNPPVPATTVSGKYVVPDYAPPGYDTLTHNSAPSCAGYFNIQGAYGKNAGSCGDKFVSKVCQ